MEKRKWQSVWQRSVCRHEDCGVGPAVKNVEQGMKIGVMLRSLGEPGGIGMYTTSILDALLRLDQRNQYFLIYKRPEHLGRFSSFSNVTERVVSAPNKLWWDQITVPRFAKAEGLDVIYNPKLSVPLVTRSKTVLVMHGADQFAAPHTFKWHDRVYFTIANRLYCKRASAIIAMTHTGAKDIVRYMGATPENIHVIHESYNELCCVWSKEKAEEVREKYSLPERFILFVGGIEPKKNVKSLFKAFAAIKSDIPHKLVLVGFNRWKMSDQLGIMDQLGIREDVVFTGFIPDEVVPATYNLADLFVFPSLYEGFGMPVLEAMACGCPVITTTTGCSPEVAGKAAILVDPLRPDEIARWIQRVLTEKTLRDELIEKGLKRAKEFSWQRCAQETISPFESLNNRGA